MARNRMLAELALLAPDGYSSVALDSRAMTYGS